MQTSPKSPHALAQDFTTSETIFEHSSRESRYGRSRYHRVEMPASMYQSNQSITSLFGCIIHLIMPAHAAHLDPYSTMSDMDYHVFHSHRDLAPYLLAPGMITRLSHMGTAYTTTACTIVSTARKSRPSRHAALRALSPSMSSPAACASALITLCSQYCCASTAPHHSKDGVLQTDVSVTSLKLRKLSLHCTNRSPWDI